MHGMTIKASAQPGILMDMTIDDNGDIDRASFIIEVQNGPYLGEDDIERFADDYGRSTSRS